MRSTVRKGVLAAVGAAALSVILTSGAVADPGFTPDSDDAVGVGSDTTEYVLNDLATAYNGTSPTPTVRVASWNATGSATITPRSGAAAINRPNGSSAGITELKRSGTAVNFARSSRARQDGDDAVLFLPFATDGLKYAVNEGTTNAPLDLTTAELKSIYDCSKTTWSAVRAGLSGTTIKPVLPQTGSGTRSFFLNSLGLTTVGSCVNATVQEHDPAAIAGDADKIGPFSVGRFQTLPTPKTIQLSTGGFSVSRKLYNVVRDTNGGGVANGGVASGLQTFFGTGTTGTTGGWICSSAATSVIANNGFTQITTNCGKAE